MKNDYVLLQHQSTMIWKRILQLYSLARALEKKRTPAFAFAPQGLAPTRMSRPSSSSSGEPSGWRLVNSLLGSARRKSAGLLTGALRSVGQHAPWAPEGAAGHQCLPPLPAVQGLLFYLFLPFPFPQDARKQLVPSPLGPRKGAAKLWAHKTSRRIAPILPGPRPLRFKAP